MTDSNAVESPWNPTWKPLSPEQRRVLGVLIEKAKTTPAAYPMTVNAVVIGSNQKSNRDPSMNLTDDDAERVLEELRVLGAVVEAPEATRSAKFRHRAYEWLGVERAELAVMAELLLRGAQTLGDLRSRAARMEPIPDMTALKPLVDGLVQRGLMIELTHAGRGQIVSHNLYEEAELAELRARYGRGADAASGEGHAPMPARAPSPDAVASLKSEIVELRAELEQLRERVAEIESATRH